MPRFIITSCKLARILILLVISLQVNASVILSIGASVNYTQQPKQNCACTFINDSLNTFYPSLRAFATKESIETAFNLNFVNNDWYLRVFCDNFQKDKNDGNITYSFRALVPGAPVKLIEPEKNIVINLTPCQPTRNEYVLALSVTIQKKTSAGSNTPKIVWAMANTNTVSFELNNPDLHTPNAAKKHPPKKDSLVDMPLSIYASVNNVNYTPERGFEFNTLDVCPVELAVGNGNSLMYVDTAEYVDKATTNWRDIYGHKFEMLVEKTIVDTKDGMAPPQYIFKPVLNTFSGLIFENVKFKIKIRGENILAKGSEILVNNHLLAGTIILNLKSNHGFDEQPDMVDLEQISKIIQIKELESNLEKEGFRVTKSFYYGTTLHVDFLNIND